MTRRFVLQGESVLRAWTLVLCYLLLATAALVLFDGDQTAQSKPETPGEHLYASMVLEQQADNGFVPEPAPAAAPKSDPPLPPPPPGYRVPQVSPSGRDISAYAGMGTWVDLYDWGKPNTATIDSLVEAMALRGVKTLYLQTGRWNLPEEIGGANTIGQFIDLSHAKGIKVIAWYLPGFGNLDLDIQRSMAAINFVSPQGRKFDGFAPDIEDPRGVGRNTTAFNLGIMEYSRRLRESVPADYALGAITLDARNNERAPHVWAGHPWPEIGIYYDIVMPMAYWTVTKPGNCLAHQMDAAQYMRDVVSKTKALMGRDLPIHPIGGIADCNTVEEVTAYVNVAMEQKWHGISLYDLVTIQGHPGVDQIWQQLQRGNELLPPAPVIPRNPNPPGRPKKG
ncbi:MAG: hypothetical protein KY429_03185 [Actinobacteria bacterium]|nr:hypothetical protein [Actinomycetota bacterium]